MTSENAPPPRRYAMFISYRHADNLEMGRKWATWLHESVENHEIPADLVGKTNLRGETVPASLYPVFRDEEELPADADLSTNIRRALENSGLLVVLCSPRAVQSRFVAEEIRYFKELGRSGRILALIIDGEPNASDDPGKVAHPGPAAECFPEPLRFGVPDGADGKVDWNARTEPIAADCRPGGRPQQGWTTAAAYGEWLEKQPGMSRAERVAEVRDYAARLELARLKVIAGALGVPLGELTQRDKARQLLRAKRRTRVLTSLSAVFAALAATAAMLGWFANEKRKDADEARGVADREKRQAVATLAISDFQEGANRLMKTSTAPAGLAYLSRAARAGHAAAAARIWTLFQQHPFWIPGTDAPETPVCQPHMANAKPPPLFSAVAPDDGGEKTAPTWYAESADGKRCVTVVSAAEAGEGPITFRVWETDGKPLGGWRHIDYQGDNYLSGIASAALSDDGRLVAIVAAPWRAPQFIEVWDVDRGIRVGGPFPAGGAQPNYQGAEFSDVWFTAPGKSGIGMLVALSSRGDAAVFRYDTGPENPSVWQHAVNAHDQPVVLATMDPERRRFASVSTDRSIRVLDLETGEAVGWPVSAPGTVTGLALNAADGLAARLDDGKAVSWRLSQPVKTVAAQTSLEHAGEKGLHKNFDNSDPAPSNEAVIADERNGAELRITGASGLEWIDTVKPGKPAIWRHHFPAAITFARFCGVNRVLVQTRSFESAVWDVAKNTPVQPVIDESALFTSDRRSDTPLRGSVSPDGTLVLTRSFFWDPPNVGTYTFTVWDAASGKPLCDPLRLIDDAAGEPGPDHAEFSQDGGALLLGRAKDGGKGDVAESLQIRPPAAALAMLPDLAEALGGLRLMPDGGLEPVRENRGEVIRKMRGLVRPVNQ